MCGESPSGFISISHLFFAFFSSLSIRNIMKKVRSLRFVCDSKFKGSENQHIREANVPTHIIIRSYSLAHQVV